MQKIIALKIGMSGQKEQTLESEDVKFNLVDNQLVLYISDFIRFVVEHGNELNTSHVNLVLKSLTEEDLNDT